MHDSKDNDPEADGKVEKKSLLKLKSVLKVVGRSAAEKILIMIYAAKSDKTPTWAKGVLVGALVYFLTPFDAIPDFIPGAGYSDDIGVILAALASVAGNIDEKVKDDAKVIVDKWWPEEEV